MTETFSEKPVLIIGGGISGITTAVELAEAGKKVVLVEHENYLGGNVVKMNNYFPKLCPPACGLEINFRRIRQNPRISIYTSSSVEQISGEKGNFTVRIKTAPQFIVNKCTACGDCVLVCPEERPDAFNYNLSNTKAVFLPHEMAFPYKYSIDSAYCKKESCAKCVSVCKYNAIDFSGSETVKELKVSSVVVATGWKNYNALNLGILGYSQNPDVLTNVEFERMLATNGPTAGKLLRPSDNAAIGEITFIQCAGSRDENHLPYCSAVCCSASLKHALNVVEKVPGCNVNIFYIDLRVSGRNEDFLERVKQHKNINLIKGKVGRVGVNQKNGKLAIEAEDIQNEKKVNLQTDLVVLATGIVPVNPVPGLITNSAGFLTEVKDGIFAVSCCRKPMDVSAAVKDATAAALKAIQN